MSYSSSIFNRGADFSVFLESFGVRLLVESNDAGLLARLKAAANKTLLGNLKFIENGDCSAAERISRRIRFDVTDHGFRYFQDGRELEFGTTLDDVIWVFDTMVAITVAEFAEGRVFLHCGVVAWKGRGILMPGTSCSGKTTLTAELVRAGAEYYSDEYAVLDADGLVYPFARDLAVREEGQVGQRPVPPSTLGNIGTQAVPVGAVVITQYVDGAEWNPKRLSVGQGMLEVIKHTIPIRANTEFCLKVLNNALSRAIIVESPRGEAFDCAKNILSLIDGLRS